MIGVLLERGKPVPRWNLPDPRPACREALVGLRLAGVCGTDRAMLGGYADFSGIMGHEFVGEVLDFPDAPDWTGQRVVGRITISCGACRQCRQGRSGHCESRRVLGIRGNNGVFAERFCLPVANLVAVPEQVSDEAAVFAEPLAAALRIVDQVQVHESDRVLVIGAGCLGQLAARVLVQSGCRLDVVARHEQQRLRLKALGIPWIPENEGRAKAYDLIVEATGNPAGFDAALQMVRPEGTVVLKSTLPEKISVDLSAVVVNEVAVVGSRCGPLDRAVQWLAEGKIDPTDLIEARFPLQEAPAAFARAADPGAFKVLFTP
jgi:2-desacetyl-2-hydroxyethyl bacteriochlorophyllide A dehydrogenase